MYLAIFGGIYSPKVIANCCTNFIASLKAVQINKQFSLPAAEVNCSFACWKWKGLNPTSQKNYSRRNKWNVHVQVGTRLWQLLQAVRQGERYSLCCWQGWPISPQAFSVNGYTCLYCQRSYCIPTALGCCYCCKKRECRRDRHHQQFCLLSSYTEFTQSITPLHIFLCL